MYVLLVVFRKLLCGLGLEILLVGADVPVRARLEVAHEPKSLCELVLEDVSLGVSYLLKQVYKHRDLSGAPRGGVRVVYVWWQL